MKRIAIFISSGIGNAVMLVPIMRLLRKNDNNSITIILTSQFVDPEFLKFNTFPIDEIIDLRKENRLNYGRKHLNYFDKTYLDYSSSSIKNLILASFISKKVLAYRKDKVFVPKTKYLKLEIDVHAVVLHAKMIDSSINEDNFSLELLKLKINDTQNNFGNKEVINYKKSIVVQVSSANLKVKYKNWPIKYWIDFLNKIIAKYPEYNILLLGDKNEISIGQEIISKVNSSKLISFIGKTSLMEACEILFDSDMYIGLDSAFMHLAVAYGIPTFTILGASSEDFIGYHKFDSKKHFVIYKELSCRPCHTWIGANKSRVSNPVKCPDNICLTGLLPDTVFKRFREFYRLNNN